MEGGKDSWNVRGFQTIINYTSTAHRFKPIASLSHLPVAPEMLLADLSECVNSFFFFSCRENLFLPPVIAIDLPSPLGHLYPATSCGSAVIASATSILISISSPLSPPLPSRFLILLFSSLPYVRTFFFALSLLSPIPILRVICLHTLLPLAANGTVHAIG